MSILKSDIKLSKTYWNASYSCAQNHYDVCTSFTVMDTTAYMLHITPHHKSVTSFIPMLAAMSVEWDKYVF